MDQDENSTNTESSYAKELGRKGEDSAQRFLEKQGYRVLERNWVCSAGEADLIVTDDETLVFVEVKTRTNESRGLPEDAVTRDKRRRYENIAISYLRSCDISEMAIRFDVIAIMVVGGERAFLRHHINAFAVGD